MEARYGVTAIAMVYRLGGCPVGEESILIAVSAPHRREALEACKARVEVRKMEEGEGVGGLIVMGFPGGRVRDEQVPIGAVSHVRLWVPGVKGRGPTVGVYHIPVDSCGRCLCG